MGDSDWIENLATLDRDVELLPGASARVLATLEAALGALPSLLRDFLSRSNGLVCRGFRVYSAFDEERPKKTWESLQRVNDPQKSDAFSDRAAFDRFIVFCDINGGYGYIDRTDSSIWYRSFAEDEEAGEIVVSRTTLSLREFIEANVAKTP